MWLTEVVIEVDGAAIIRRKAALKTPSRPVICTVMIDMHARQSTCTCQMIASRFGDLAASECLNGPHLRARTTELTTAGLIPHAQSDVLGRSHHGHRSRPPTGHNTSHCQHALLHEPDGHRRPERY